MHSRLQMEMGMGGGNYRFITIQTVPLSSLGFGSSFICSNNYAICSACSISVPTLILKPAHYNFPSCFLIIVH